MCVLEGEDQVRGRNVVVHAGWTVDISKDSSVVEHLTSGAGFNFPVQPYIFHLCFYMLFIPPIPSTNTNNKGTILCSIHI